VDQRAVLGVFEALFAPKGCVYNNVFFENFFVATVFAAE
jgi:hypothetical protein